MDSEIEVSRWFERKAIAFMREHPALTVERSFRKVLAGFSWRLNPVHEPLAQ